MNNNKKGLSTIVATLLIILLTLVAVGIVWFVVRNVVQGGSNQADISSKCLQVDVAVTNVQNDSSTGSLDVTLSRQGGQDDIGGIKLVFTNDSGTVSSVADIVGNIAPLATVTKNVSINSDLTNASKVSVVVYFLDSSGKEQLCSSNANEFQF